MGTVVFQYMSIFCYKFMGMDARPFLLSDFCLQSGWWFQTWIVIFHVIYGMSSFPLTNSIIFQDGYCTTNQILKSIHLGMVYTIYTIYTIINHYKPRLSFAQPPGHACYHYRPLLTTIKAPVLLKQSSSMEASSIPKIQLDGNHWTGLNPTWHMNLWGLGGTVPLQTSGIWL